MVEMPIVERRKSYIAALAPLSNSTSEDHGISPTGDGALTYT